VLAFYLARGLKRRRLSFRFAEYHYAKGARTKNVAGVRGW